MEGESIAKKKNKNIIKFKNKCVPYVLPNVNELKYLEVA